MKLNKVMYRVAFITALLTSCSSHRTLSVVKGLEKVKLKTSTENVVGKKSTMTQAQIRNWPHADIFKDSIPGISLYQAYDFLKDKKPSPMVVGVIDSGVDIEHQDLRDIVWANPGETVNGKDDNGNGYIDDINGWNFLGSSKGDAGPEQLELTRLVKLYGNRFEGKTSNQIDPKDQDDYRYYLNLKSTYDEKIEETKKVAERELSFVNTIEDIQEALENHFEKPDYTLEQVRNIETDDKELEEKANFLLRLRDYGFSKKRQELYKEHFQSQLNADREPNYNLNFDGRSIVGDNPNDINDIGYGNPNVIGSKDDEIHGTHVSGIIASIVQGGIKNDGTYRKDQKDNIENIKIMTIRAIPDGDEYDKDVALAIRYAVNNGAKVINMSFGKEYSPNQQWVIDAFKYASKKDVLLVHAAGNDNKDLDVSNNFPTDTYDKKEKFVDNVITVGAISRYFNENLPANFSNYGKHTVDIFAPGFEIYSTFPKDKYESIQGTSMAAPEVAGVATLVRSYYPDLSAKQVKEIIMASGIKFHKYVKIPGAKVATKPFDQLSVSGRILNAYNALILANAMSKNRG